MQTEWERDGASQAGDGGKASWVLPVVLGVLGVLGMGVFCLLGNAFYTGFSHGFNNARYHAYRAHGDEDYARGDYGLAADEYGRMTVLRPHAPNGYRLRADCYYCLGRYTAAIADEDAALQRADPTDTSFLAELYYNRGNAYDARQDYALAVADYTTTLRLAPGDRDTLRARCGAYQGAHDYVHALQDADALIAPHPLDGGGYRLRASIRQAAGDHVRAAADYRRAILLSPDSTDAYDALAQMYDDDGEDAQAAQVALAEVRSHPDSAPTWGTLGWWQYKAGDCRACLLSSRHALALDSHQTFVWLNIGLCDAVQGDWPAAERTYQDILPYCRPEDVQSGLGDLHDAAKRHPHDLAISQSIALLNHGGA